MRIVFYSLRNLLYRLFPSNSTRWNYVNSGLHKYKILDYLDIVLTKKNGGSKLLDV